MDMTDATFLPGGKTSSTPSCAAPELPKFCFKSQIHKLYPNKTEPMETPMSICVSTGFRMSDLLPALHRPHTENSVG